MYANILVAVDGSDLANQALEQACKLARALGSKVTVVTVVEPTAIAGGGYPTLAAAGFEPIPELIEAHRAVAQGILEKASAAASGHGVAAAIELVEDSFAAEGIIAAAEKAKAELIVMGSHGRRGLGRLLLGSQTSNVLAHTKIPVLVTR